MFWNTASLQWPIFKANANSWLVAWFYLFVCIALLFFFFFICLLIYLYIWEECRCLIGQPLVNIDTYSWTHLGRTHTCKRFVTMCTDCATIKPLYVFAFTLLDAILSTSYKHEFCVSFFLFIHQWPPFVSLFMWHQWPPFVPPYTWHQWAPIVSLYMSVTAICVSLYLSDRHLFLFIHQWPPFVSLHTSVTAICFS